jgi:small subunit ribosomal protein S12
MTIQQKLRTSFTFKIKKPNRLLALGGCPQKKGTCLKAYIMTPRKPNSAKRKVTRVILTNYQKVTSYVPGVTSNLQKHSTVLVRGGRTKDLPGLRYKNIRGKYDFHPLYNRRNGCSKYGAKTAACRSSAHYKKCRLWRCSL